MAVAALFIRPIIFTTLRISPANCGSKYYVNAMKTSAFGTATLAFVISTAHGMTLIQLYSAQRMINIKETTFVLNDTKNVVLMVKKCYISNSIGPYPNASAIEFIY
jgi:hypothetical protein